MYRKLSLLMVSAFILGQTIGAQERPLKALAVVNGQPISAEEVESAAASAIANLEFRKTQFEMEMQRDRDSVLENTLDNLLKERVLAAEAAARSVAVHELLAVEVDANALPPSDEAIAQFYAANRSALEGSLDDHAETIRAYLQEDRKQAAHDAFLDGLKKKYGAVSLLEPLRIAIATEGRPAKGPPNAPVTLVEFSDFECPYCRALSPTLQKIAAEYADKLRIVYLQFPLADMHPHALKAAEASLCAFRQGKFWEMHDAMFENQASLSIQDLKRKAAELSIDVKAFQSCLDGSEEFSRVRSDVGEGVKAGVSGTPALVINGRLLVGNQPVGEIRRIIDDELRRAAAR